MNVSGCLKIYFLHMEDFLIEVSRSTTQTQNEGVSRSVGPDFSVKGVLRNFKEPCISWYCQIHSRRTGINDYANDGGQKQQDICAVFTMILS